MNKKTPYKEAIQYWSGFKSVESFLREFELPGSYKEFWEWVSTLQQYGVLSGQIVGRLESMEMYDIYAMARNEENDIPNS